jgi:hypothetical protein
VSSRAPQRQGVVYGPPRFPSDEGSNSVLVGRILGLGMVGLALAVLGGAFVLVNRPPGPTPTRQIGPTPSPVALASPTTSPSSSPTPTAALPTPTPSPSPLVVTVQTGPGFVTFGTQLKPDRTIADPRATFVPSDRIAWSGALSQAADSSSVTVRLYKLDDTAPGGQQLISEGAAQPAGKGALIFTRHNIKPNGALRGPGTYLVQYLMGEQVLSQGYFQLSG